MTLFTSDMEMYHLCGLDVIFFVPSSISFYTCFNCVVAVLCLAGTAGAAVPHSAVAASTCVHVLSFASRLYTLDTLCSTP
jgi:hypothetical protein